MNRISRLLVVGIFLSLCAQPISTSRAMSTYLDNIPPRPADFIHKVLSGDRGEYYLDQGFVSPREQPNSPQLTPPANWMKLVYQGYKNNNWDIYEANPDGTGIIAVAKTGSIEADPAYTKNAQGIAFESNRKGNLEIYKINTNGSGLTRLTNNPASDTNPAWSPDGTKIVFQSTRTGNSDLFTMNADGSGLTQLTSSPYYDGEASWSPDGMKIVYVSNQLGTYDIWVMNSNGSDQHPMSRGQNTATPAWSPSGDKIAYANDENNDGFYSLWIMNSDGSNPVLRRGPNAQFDYWNPTWSPDSQYIAFILTGWSLYKGQYYWSVSNLYFDDLTGQGLYLPISDDTIWKASWGSDDVVPPGPCQVTIPAQYRSKDVPYTFNATDQGASGIGSYDVQARISPDETWQYIDSYNIPGGGVFNGPDFGQIEFRCRARDRADNVGDWFGPVASTTVDASLPYSIASAEQRYVEGTSTKVSIKGIDQGSGIATYDLISRDISTDKWSVVKTGITGTTTQFEGEPGLTYYLRSQAHDVSGNTQVWEPIPQATVSFYNSIITTTVSDLRNTAVPSENLSLFPTPVFTQTQNTGSIQWYVGGHSSYTVTTSASGYAPESIPINLPAEVENEVVLQPVDNAFANGNFEDGLANWSITGDGQISTTLDSRHSGNLGLELSRPLTGTASATQGVSINNNTHEATLSFLYKIPSDLGSGTLTAQLDGGITSTLVTQSAATDGWVHSWIDLSALAGQSITLTFSLSGTDSSVYIDEVSLGPWDTPIIEDVTPHTWPGDESAQITITGSNFIATPMVFIGNIRLDNVTWVNSSYLLATIPAGLKPGTYDLEVINPGGQSNLISQILAPSWQVVYLPLTLRNSSSNLAGPVPSDWPTIGYDGTHAGVSPTDPGASQYSLDWTYQSQAGDDAIFLQESDGILVANASNETIGLDANTGKLIWTASSGDPATIANGKAYYNNGSFIYVDLLSGNKNLSTNSTESISYLAPVAVGNNIFAGSGGNAKIYSLNAGSMQENWSTYITSLTAQDTRLWTPAYEDGVVYVWNGYDFQAYSADFGSLLWKITINHFWPGIAMYAIPTIVGQTAIINAGYFIDAINLNTHALIWSTSGRFVFCDSYSYCPCLPSVYNQVVYAYDNDTLDALSSSNGSILWTFSGDGELRRQPVIAGNHLYVSSNTHTYMLNLTAHQVEWQTDHGGWLAVANRWLYIGSPDGNIYAYRSVTP